MRSLNSRILWLLKNYYTTDIRGLDFNTFISIKELQHLIRLVDKTAAILEKKKALTALEIGSWRGTSSVYIATALKNYPYSRLICVDTWKVPDDDPVCLNTWKKEGMPDLLKIFTKNMSLLNLSDIVEFKIGSSIEIVPTLKEKFDFIFIDGNHNYEYINKDLKNALIKVDSGIISGHDYSRKHPGVVKAVNENFNRVELFCSVWSKAIY